MEVAKCVQKSLWLVPSASSVTTILPRKRRTIPTGWKPVSIADSAESTQYTKKQNSFLETNQFVERYGLMGDSAEKKAKPSFFKGVKTEFKKIIWPDRNSTIRQSVAVVAISVVVGVLIAIIDYVAKYGVNFITSI